MVPQESMTDALTASDKGLRGSQAHETLKNGPWLLPALGRRFPYAALQYLLMSVDAGVIAFSSLIGGAFYQLVANGDFKSPEQLLGAGIMSALLYVLLGHSSGFYDLRAVFSRRKDAARIFLQWSLVILLLSQLAFLMKVGASFSRGSVLCYGTLAFMLLIISRRFSKRLVVSAVSEGRVQGRATVLLGTRAELAALGQDELLERFGLAEVERVTLSSVGVGGFSMTEDEETALDKALSIARDRGVDEIVLALPWNDTRKLELIRDRLRVSPLPVRLLPDRRIRSVASNPSYRLGQSLSVEVQRGPLSQWEQLAKRIVDVIGASIGLLILAPLMILTAVAVKLDSPGPVFFRQRRNGFNAKQFPIFKFRTMTVMEDGAVVTQAQRFDPRVTRVGRLLRRSSIDEIPQLLNVLFGDMSLVGPRPHALAHDDHYGDLLSEYAFRHHVKPGITGWAQVRGYRGETARVEQMKGRVDCDIWYINNWTLTLDIKIIMMTCFEVVHNRNAY